MSRTPGYARFTVPLAVLSAVAVPLPASETVAVRESRAVEVAVAESEESPSSQDDPAPIQEPEAEEEDGLLVDARSYARENGVGIEVALERLNAQDDLGAIRSDAAEAFPETFAGAEVDHGEQLSTVLFFTSDRDEGAAKRLIPADLPDHVSVAVRSSALLSEEESSAIVSGIRIPEPLAGHVDGIDYDPSADAVVFDVLRAAGNGAEALLQREVARVAGVSRLPVPDVALRLRDVSASDGNSGGYDRRGGH